jgi:hypothetical protein
LLTQFFRPLPNWERPALDWKINWSERLACAVTELSALY